jgi:hypothetical protein
MVGSRLTGRILAAGLVALTATCSAFGQDSHYWSSHYGTQAQLLGGLVVGSSNDLSATFYNPGALALTRDTTLVLSTLTQQFTNIELRLKTNPPIQAESNESGPSPSIFALRLPPDLIAGQGLAFSYIVRNRVKVDLHGRTIASAPELSVADDAHFFQDLSDTWVGLSWASRVVDSIAFGVTWYVAPMSQRQRTQTIRQSANTTGGGSTVVEFLDFYYNNFRTLFKVGFYFDHRPFSVGLSVTTPSLNLFNTSGWVMASRSVVVSDSADGLAELASNYQTDLTSRYQSPLSIAVGAAYSFSSTSLYFSAEWFDAVSEYEVLNTTDFVSQTTGEPVSVSLTQTRTRVFNFGAGFHHRFSTLFTLYGSLLVDRSFLPQADASPVNLASYDLTHITGGVSFTVPMLELTLGVSYAFGSDSYTATRPLFQKVSSPTLVSNPTPLEVNYSRLGFVLGFTLRMH